MLERLLIRDLALIESVELEVRDGLTVISGETGGGKSLLVQALRLLRGERGRSGLVRRGAKHASIDAVFSLAGRGERSRFVRELYAEILGHEPQERELILSRVIDEQGRSRARVDGRPVPLRVLQDFGAWLIEIHGQGSHRSLMRPEIQTELLDAYAGLGEQRQAFAARLVELRADARRLDKMRRSDLERDERRDFLAYRLAEIDRVAPEVGEVERIDRDLRVCENLDRLRRGLSESAGELGERESSIVERLGAVQKRVEELAEVDPELAELPALLDEALVNCQEAARELSSRLAALDVDASALESLRARWSELERLLERFGPSEGEVLAARDQMRAELSELETGSGEQELAARLESGRLELAELGKKLDAARGKAARRLAKLAASELRDLGMERVQFEARVVANGGEAAEHDILESATELGTSRVELWIAPNPGEAMAPLREIASGGEVARVMLVVKKILADADRVPVLVFDEIDSEIGGRLGLAVGRKLQELAEAHQLLCITHLPQIAACGDEHWLVHKVVAGAKGSERTVTSIEALDIEARRRELASMTRGEEAIDAAAMREAKRLLELGQAES